MGLSSELISQFVKITKDNKKTSNETTVYGTVVYDGKPYVKLDGSDLLTPISTTADVTDGERVTVMIKNHTATVTGNMSSPAARTDDVKDIANEISEFEIVMAYKVTTEDLEAVNATIESLRGKAANFENLEAFNAEIENLEAKFANLEYVNAEDVEAITANIESLQATFGDFTDISTEELEALNAEITTLKGYTADFTYVSADVLDAIKASIKTLEAEKLSAKDADLKYANIDFANIGEAAIEKFFAKSGLIEDIVVGDGTITGHLVGVTISGDLIEGNTIKAEKLVVKGEDGLYYKLNIEGGVTSSEEVTDEQLQNGLHGSVIIAKSITAEQISVKDLVALGATIGGFNITDKAIYSGAKASADNTTKGVYMDSDGQFSLGDSNNFLKFYKAADGSYKLAISADSLIFSTTGKNVEDVVNDTVSNIAVGARNLIRNSKTLIFDDYYFTEVAMAVSHDGEGNVTVLTNAATITSDENGDAAFVTTVFVFTDDGNGNIIIS